MPGPTDGAGNALKDALKSVQADVQTNHRFLARLFDAEKGPKLRHDLFNQADEKGLREFLNRNWKISIREGVKIMLVDIENAQTKVYGPPIKPTDNWYVLVLPPVPRRSTDLEYVELQAWSEASFHATNDGYGM